MPKPVQPDHWIAVSDRLPEQHQEVLILVADESVAIDAMPLVGRLQIEFAGTEHRRDDWWTGLPGQWRRLPADGWIVTHWTPLPTWRDGHWRTRGSCLATPDPDFDRRAPGPAPYVDPLADEAGNRHHKDGSRCVDAYCRRAHAIPRRHLEPR